MQGDDTMKRNIYRLVLLLCAAMLSLTLICSAQEAEVIASGECGDDLTWTLTEDGELRIEGTGTMWDFHNDAYSCSGCSLMGCTNPYAPWENYYRQIRTVYLAEGVTTVGENSFVDSYDIDILVYPAGITNLAWVWYSEVREVYYYGTPEQWADMDCPDSGYDRATIHYVTAQYEYAENDMHTAAGVCSECEARIDERPEPCTDKNGDDVCDLCKGKPSGKITAVGSNMTLGNELEVNVMVKREDVADRNCTAVITHARADGTDHVTELPQEQWETVSVYYAIPIKVAAKEMADQLSVHLVDENGVVCSEVYTTSVCDYAAKAMSNEIVTENMKRLVADMLNYGAQAQKYFGYNEDNYADSVLTAQQQTYGTGDVSSANTQIKGPNCIGGNLALESSLRFNMFFDGIAQAELPDVTAVVYYTDYRGNVQVGSCRVEASADGICMVVVDQIVLADARCPVTVTVYKNGAPYSVAVDSVESYAARASGELAGLSAAVLKFADSARTYLLTR